MRSAVHRTVVVERGDPPVGPGEREIALQDPDGAVVAYGWTAGADRYLEFPELATFRFAAGDSTVVAIPHDGTAPDAVMDAYYGEALPLALQADGFEVLHASGVETDAGVVAFCATSGTGKSTTAYALAARGYSLWSDDAVAFEATGERPVCHRLPFRSRLRPDAAALLAPGAASPMREEPGARPLTAVLVLTRNASDGPVSGEQLGTSEALSTLLEHAHRFSVRDPERMRATMATYLELIRAVPVLRVSFAPGLDRLASVTEELTLIVDGLAARDG